MRNKRFRVFSAVLAAAVAVGGFASFAQNDGQGKKTSNHGNKLAATTRNDKPGAEGEHVFAEHCSRCHNAPEGFSPRIGKTVIRHMRVRANLSEDEERALLHFLNP